VRPTEQGDRQSAIMSHDDSKVKRQRINAIKMSVVMSFEALEQGRAPLPTEKARHRIICDANMAAKNATEDEFRTAITELRSLAKRIGDDQFDLVLQRLVE
jgi:hypothetical protein